MPRLRRAAVNAFFNAFLARLSNSLVRAIRARRVRHRGGQTPSVPPPGTPSRTPSLDTSHEERRTSSAFARASCALTWPGRLQSSLVVWFVVLGTNAAGLHGEDLLFH